MTPPFSDALPLTAERWLATLRWLNAQPVEREAEVRGEACAWLEGARGSCVGAPYGIWRATRVFRTAYEHPEHNEDGDAFHLGDSIRDQLEDTWLLEITQQLPEPAPPMTLLALLPDGRYRCDQLDLEATPPQRSRPGQRLHTRVQHLESDYLFPRHRPEPGVLMAMAPPKQAPSGQATLLDLSCLDYHRSDVWEVIDEVSWETRDGSPSLRRISSSRWDGLYVNQVIVDYQWFAPFAPRGMEDQP